MLERLHLTQNVGEGMEREQLYELAFQYKKTKLWQKMWDRQVFAIKLSDGRIGIISIMGALGDFCALSLYIGQSGIDSFRKILRDPSCLHPFEAQELFVQQECLQCAFVGKDDISKEAQDEVREYARSHGIRLAGKNAYPQFIKLRRNCFPWRLETEQDEDDLRKALLAALEVSRLLENGSLGQLGIESITEETNEVPILEFQDGVFVWGKTVLPEKMPEAWPEPLAANDVAVANLKRAVRTGVWECQIVRSVKPVQNEPDQIPFFPLILLAADPDAAFLLPVSPVDDYEAHPEELLQYFMEELLQHKICPEEMRVADQRTYGLFKDFCRRLRIPLKIEEDLPALKQVQAEFLERADMTEEEELEELLEIVDDLLELNEEDWKNMPAPMVDMLKELAEQDQLPMKAEKRLKKLFQTEESSSPKKITSVKKKAGHVQSYVISVSLETGCYRHIQISENSTLEELHSAILDAFEFLDDHAHAFFMDNKKWSDFDCYYCEEVAEDAPVTRGCKLKKAGLYKGKQFKYVFDFGYEWTFQCKVLRIAEEDTKSPLVVKTKGEAPLQYGDWDDDDWEDE